jgi:DNA-binding NarL/FixJ family response regulator
MMARALGLPERHTKGKTVRRRILIADDHEIMRKGLRFVLSSRIDLQVCGEAASGLEAIAKSQQLEPDLILMDVSMPDMDGLEATRGILKSRPQQKIVMFTVHESEEFACAAMRAGAKAAVRKTSTPEQLWKAIDAVLFGHDYFPSMGPLPN